MDIGVYDDYEDYEEVEFVAKSDKRYIVLVIYDIVDNKRRNRMVKCLERYGVRVQKSAFGRICPKFKFCHQQNLRRFLQNDSGAQ